MSWRAIIIGFVGAAIVCGFGFFNDFVLKQSLMVGSYFPMSVYGGLILFVLAVNPMLKMLNPKWMLTGPELAVVICLALAACCIPGRGLMHHFNGNLIFPQHYQKTKPDWKKAKVVETIPKAMLVDVSDREDEVLGSFIQGMSSGNDRVKFSEIPVSAWLGPMKFWLPLLLSMVLALLGLSLVVHRQWSGHEQLPYPIVTFAKEILPGQGKALGDVFQSKLFWGGAIAVLLIHLNNYYFEWHRDDWIEFTRQFNFLSVRSLWLFKTIYKGGGFMLFVPILFFTVIGFSYFLSSEVSFSMAIAPWFYCLFSGYMIARGTTISGGFYDLSIERFLYAGAFFGLFSMLLYTGRYYYWGVLKSCLGFSAKEKIEGSAIFGMRAFIIGALLFVVQLCLVGLEWYFAIAYTALFIIIALVLSRLVAETGAFFVHSFFFPTIIILGFIGERSVAPASVLIMFFITATLMADPREIFMPFIVHGLKLVDSEKVKIGKPAASSFLVVLLALAIAIPVTLWWQYDQGANQVGDEWSLNVINQPLDSWARMQSKYEAQGGVGNMQTQSAGEWLREHFEQNSPYMIAFFSTLFLVVLFMFLRIRLVWWPLHPVLFLVMGTYHAKMLAFSFALGWLIKVLVTRFGGARTYQKFKPLMIGLIAGEMLAGVLFMLFGFYYYFMHGTPPPFIYRIFAG